MGEREMPCGLVLCVLLQGIKGDNYTLKGIFIPRKVYLYPQRYKYTQTENTCVRIPIRTEFIMQYFKEPTPDFFKFK